MVIRDIKDIDVDEKFGVGLLILGGIGTIVGIVLIIFR